MIEFIDKTNEQDGTPISREKMMALQGFVATTTNISADGKTIVETNKAGHTLTTTISENEIVEKFVGEKTITKTTTIANGNFTEVVS